MVKDSPLAWDCLFTCFLKEVDVYFLIGDILESQTKKGFCSVYRIFYIRSSKNLILGE